MNNETNFEINFKLTKQLWINLYSIQDLLNKYGIYIEIDGISFDLEKINPDSLAKKENINGMEFTNSVTSSYHKYDPTIFLMRNNERLNNKEFGYPKKIDSLFPTKDFLINIFEITGIKCNNENKINTIIKDLDEIIKMTKNETYLNNFKMLQSNMEFSEIKNNTLNNIKNLFTYLVKTDKETFDEQEILFNDYKKKYFENKISKEKYLKSIKEKLLIITDPNIKKDLEFEKNECERYLKFNDKEKENMENNVFPRVRKKLNEKIIGKVNNIKKKLSFLNDIIFDSLLYYLKSNIIFEPILFSEIFNINKEKIDDINFLKQNYIYYANKIKKSLDKIDDISLLFDEIDEFLNFKLI